MEISTSTAYLIALAAAVVVAVVVWIALKLRGSGNRGDGNHYVEALRMLIDGDTDGAFTRLEQAVRAGTAPVDAYVRLGALLRQRGDAGRALQMHKGLTVKADLTHDEKVKVYTNIAEDYAKLGRAEQAIEVLETLVKRLGVRTPAVFEMLARQSHMLARSEDTYGYLKDLKKAGGIGDRELALYLATGASDLFAAGKPREARKMLHRALKHDPKCAGALLALGDIDESEQRSRDAVDNWKAAARISADLAPAALQRLERTLFQTGNFGDIERVYRDILEARPDGSHATVALASFYRKQGRAEEAISLLEEFTHRHPADGPATMALLSLYGTHRSAEDVEKLLERKQPGPAESAVFRCDKCRYESKSMRWHCPRCNRFDTFIRHAH